MPAIFFLPKENCGATKYWKGLNGIPILWKAAPISKPSYTFPPIEGNQKIFVFFVSLSPINNSNFKGSIFGKRNLLVQVLFPRLISGIFLASSITNRVN